MTAVAKRAVVECEGCDQAFETQLTPTGRVSFKGIPHTWVQCGRSKKRPGFIATWCVDCYQNGRMQQMLHES